MATVTAPIKTVWIIGLSASGKTTLARLLIKRLQENGHPCVIIDGSEARDLFENKLGFDPESRRKQTARIRNLAQWAISQRIIPVVAMIHPFEDDRRKCRAEIPGYYEVYLECPLEECMRRDDKNVYGPAVAGTVANVVGLDIPYDDPATVELRLHSDRQTPEALLETLWTTIRDRLIDNRLDIHNP